MEESLKKQILPAAKLTCLLPPAEKTFLENLSCENAVAFIYILFRLLYKHIGNPEPSRKDSIELWERIWDFAQQIPIVKAEWEQMEERNDLKGWKKDLQEYARNKWDTLIMSNFLNTMSASSWFVKMFKLSSTLRRLMNRDSAKNLSGEKTAKNFPFHILLIFISFISLGYFPLEYGIYVHRQ